MKKFCSPNGRRHGLRSRTVPVRSEKTVLTFERRTQVYCWTTDRGRARSVVKH
jgi:hypothetical protein